MILGLIVFITSASIAQAPFWQPTNGPDGGNILAISITPDNVLYASAEGQGVFRSEDGGDNWIQSSNGLPLDLQIRALAIDSTGMLYAGTMGLGVFQSSDAGVNWMQVADGLTYPYVHSLAVDPENKILAGTGGGLVFHSTDHGSTWEGVKHPDIEPYYLALC